MTAEDHGSASTYANYGCRCADCRDAQAAKQRVDRVRRRTRVLLNPDVVEHGLYSTYSNWKCRCADCCRANTEGCAAYQQRRREDES